jgi:hypothetical protein
MVRAKRLEPVLTQNRETVLRPFLRGADMPRSEAGRYSITFMTRGHAKENRRSRGRAGTPAVYQLARHALCCQRPSVPATGLPQYELSHLTAMFALFGSLHDIGMIVRCGLGCAGDRGRAGLTRSGSSFTRQDEIQLEIRNLAPQVRQHVSLCKTQLYEASLANLQGRTQCLDSPCVKIGQWLGLSRLLSWEV